MITNCPDEDTQRLQLEQNDQIEDSPEECKRNPISSKSPLNEQLQLQRNRSCLPSSLPVLVRYRRLRYSATPIALLFRSDRRELVDNLPFIYNTIVNRGVHKLSPIINH
jgi:hypothetical protein